MYDSTNIFYKVLIYLTFFNFISKLTVILQPDVLNNFV